MDIHPEKSSGQNQNAQGTISGILIKTKWKSLILAGLFVAVIKKVYEWSKEELIMAKISRYQMGAYQCIASNGVPPSISKRIIVHVHCKLLFHFRADLPDSYGRGSFKNCW